MGIQAEAVQESSNACFYLSDATIIDGLPTAHTHCQEDKTLKKSVCLCMLVLGACLIPAQLRYLHLGG